MSWDDMSGPEVLASVNAELARGSMGSIELEGRMLVPWDWWRWVLLGPVINLLSRSRRGRRPRRFTRKEVL